ncbi:MAG TPA: hypothetical protein VM680_06845 [Verrucomicrobiae bacterium]|nr:hypothetical protein [Verrucomicrobiae bacterium]
MNYADFTHIPAALRNKAEMELRSGERILWTAQPIAARVGRASWPLVIFGIFWTAFSVFWVAAAGWGAWRNSTPGPFKLFPLFGVPFVLIGIGMLTSPIWMRKKAAKTVYMITDQRAVILSQGLRGKTRVESYAPAQLQSITRDQFADGSGDIIFETRTWRDSDGDRRTSRVGFFAVPDVKTVEDHIRTLAQKITP